MVKGSSDGTLPKKDFNIVYFRKMTLNIMFILLKVEQYIDVEMYSICYFKTVLTVCQKNREKGLKSDFISVYQCSSSGIFQHLKQV